MTAIKPQITTPWLDNNYVYDGGNGIPTACLGPKQSVYACPGYNRLQGKVSSNPNGISPRWFVEHNVL
jgi:hypothetical protein